MHTAFITWLESRTRQSPLPEVTRLTQLIAAAGPGGVMLRDLRRIIKLNHDLVDQLLTTLVGAGQLTVAEVGGEIVYYALS